MKTLRTVSALILASVLAFSATAMANNLMAPQAAVETNAMVKSVQDSLEVQGYTLETVDEDALRYLVRPHTPFVWGTLVYTYSRPGHSLMLPREKVELTVQLKYLATGVAVPQLSVRELLGQ
jgi:hypothetical protein